MTESCEEAANLSLHFTEKASGPLASPEVGRCATQLHWAAVNLPESAMPVWYGGYTTETTKSLCDTNCTSLLPSSNPSIPHRSKKSKNLLQANKVIRIAQNNLLHFQALLHLCHNFFKFKGAKNIAMRYYYYIFMSTIISTQIQYIPLTTHTKKI